MSAAGKTLHAACPGQMRAPLGVAALSRTRRPVPVGRSARREPLLRIFL